MTPRRDNWLSFGDAILAVVVGGILASSTPVNASALKDAHAAFAKQDYAAGMTNFQEAADQGGPEALAMLGTMYFYGIGVPYDLKKALELNQKAAEQGRVDAQYIFYLGYFLTSNENDVYGPARERIIADSIKWLRTAEVGVVAKAEEGDSTAQWVCRPPPSRPTPWRAA